MAVLTAHSPLYLAPGSHTGLLVRGNIDIHARPVIMLASGSIATMKTTLVNLHNPLFSHEGPDLYAKAFAHNRPFAKKGPYQTKLTSNQEKQFRLWLVQWKVPFDPNARIVDYDMRGYWLAVRGAPHKPGTHFPDTFKTPYDTTFSRESKYATRENPFTWDGNNLIDKRTGQVVFGQSKFSRVVVVVPSVAGNRLVGHAGAVSQWQKTGRHFGWFDNAAHAHAYAAALSREQARYYKQQVKR